MDGASKFVRGDAVASLIITAINILGGFAIGVFQQGLDVAQALSTYTILTIGDGLVTQIPALIVSTAAGIVVTRAAAESDLSRDLVGQLTFHPRALALAAGVLTILAIVPGMPTVPFLILAAVTGGGARLLHGSRIAAAKKKEEAAPAPTGPETVETLLALDPLELEVGYSLVPLVDPAKGGDLLERVRMLRRQFALDMGFVVPPVRIRDNLQLASTHYAIKLRGFEVAQGEVYADRFLAMNPGTAQEGLEGIETREPTFGLPALWITSRQKERAQAAGYTVVDPSTVIATHLSEAIRSHARDLLSRQDTQILVDQVKGSQPAVVEGLIPNLLPLGTVQKVLQNLLSESVSIRDLPQILEVLADYAPHTKDPAALTEYVRAILAKTVCRPHLSQEQTLRVLVLSPQSESALTELLEGEGGNVDVRAAQQIIEAVATAIAEAPLDGRPVLLVSPSVRPHLRRLTERPFPHLAVLSYNEVPSQVTVQSIGTVEFANVYQAV
jgi:flagellar biosynthesis protein FlhA